MNKLDELKTILDSLNKHSIEYYMAKFSNDDVIIIKDKLAIVNGVGELFVRSWNETTNSVHFEFTCIDVEVISKNTLKCKLDTSYSSVKLTI